MKNVLKILAMVGKILVYVLVVLGSLLSLVTAYIVLAPDDLPKPFRLSYMYPTPTLSETPIPGTETVVATDTMETKPGAGVMVDTGTKIINLAQNGGNKYIRIDVVLEFAQPVEPTPAKKAASSEGGDTAAVTAATELTNEINARLPMVNDTVITLLSSKTFDELYTSTGKEALRGELMQKLQAMMPEYKIIGVYFTEFVVE
jgi:flagellar basal body-associated protein FliL